MFLNKAEILKQRTETMHRNWVPAISEGPSVELKAPVS